MSALIDAFLERHFYGLRGPMIAELARRGLWRKLANYILAELEIKLRTKTVRAMPYWLSIDPCSACALRCPFCPTGSGKATRTKAMLCYGEFEKIMSRLGPYLLKVEFTNWGEPLMNPDIGRMIALAKSYDCHAILSSHLNHFNERIADELLASGLDLIVLSIDGASARTYSRYRVGGDFELVMRHLELLVRRRRELGRKKPYLYWQFLVFKHNEHEIEAVKELGRRMGVDEVAIRPAVIPEREWFPTGAGRAVYGDGSYPPVLNAAGYRRYEQEEHSFCVWPWLAVVINANASVSPCCAVEDEADDYGRYFEQDVRRLRNNAEFKLARQYLKDRRAAPAGRQNACTRCPVIGKVNPILPRSWNGVAWEKDRFDGGGWN